MTHIFLIFRSNNQKFPITPWRNTPVKFDTRILHSHSLYIAESAINNLNYKKMYVKKIACEMYHANPSMSEFIDINKRNNYAVSFNSLKITIVWTRSVKLQK